MVIDNLIWIPGLISYILLKSFPIHDFEFTIKNFTQIKPYWQIQINYLWENRNLFKFNLLISVNYYYNL